MEPPSKTSSSCPPTALTYTNHEPVCNARARQISTRSAPLPWWYGRSVDVQDDLWTRALVFIERRVVVPGVLADRETELRRCQSDGARSGPRHEVPLLVEDAEVGKLDLVVTLLDMAVADQRRGIVQPLLRTVHEPDHDRARRAGCGSRQRIERGQVVIDESASQDQVLGGVAGDRELREADQVGALVRGPRRPLHHACDVAVEIADGRVQLAECDANHERSLRDPTTGTRGAERYSVPPMSTL